VTKIHLVDVVENMSWPAPGEEPVVKAIIQSYKRIAKRAAYY
jgi:hypothetical protein